ncbi:unnamed protein product [Fraxinus pennsylvanica]|uniref:Uncharacterized protein n=1 Tax=Fraxinus pennsylvanica TaxID=56036 RepID=A0AAD2A4W6_9LAMI|nr:unnamed protein product [Fraxinus pennsylvanica]
MKGIEEPEESKIWDCGSPCYDSYELVSMSHLIERHFMILPYDLRGSSKASSNEIEESTIKYYLSELVERRARKRKRKMDAESKKKKERKTGIPRICNWICLWAK